jgi:GT2 family glycosyltransferase
MISIIIPCYNHFNLTRDLLISISDNTMSDYEIILIDDCSSDATKNLCQDELGITTLVRHTTNLGFPRSVNDGIAAAQGEFIAIFNNDVVVKPNWDIPLVMSLEKYPDLGMVMGRCYNSEQDYLPKDTHDIRVWDRGLPFFMRKELQLSLGPWDEQFFPSWFDDIDMEIRLVKAGYVFGVVEDSRCIHFGSQTIGKIEKGWEDYKEKSAEKFRNKWKLDTASAFIDFKRLRFENNVVLADWDTYQNQVYTVKGGPC